MNYFLIFGSSLVLDKTSVVFALVDSSKSESKTKLTRDRFGIGHADSCWESIFIKKGLVYYMPELEHSPSAAGFEKFVSSGYLKDSRMTIEVPSELYDENSYFFLYVSIASVCLLFLIMLAVIVTRKNKPKTI